MKKRITILLLALAACIFVACSANKPEEEISPELDKAVGKAILKDSEGGYRDGECQAEGHIIMGAEKVFDNEIEVYVLTSYGEYGFENGEFNKISGTGCIPEVMNFSTENGYEVINITYPKDGSEYVKSIKEMFPSQYEKRAMNPSKEDLDSLSMQEIWYADEYLTSIGRPGVQIVNYSERTLLEDEGVSTEVGNELLDKQKDLLVNYPWWIGTREQIEDGTRYIYEMTYDKEENKIKYSKTNVETNTEVE
ncbi:MAG: hypothetical protein MJ246_05120 [Clostridia bacterium]|nr:hypothetical protein [Clostridia bacterium]